MNIAELLGPWVQHDFVKADVLNIQSDSRLIKPGDLFLAYAGHRTDGRLYIQQALKAGAVAVLYDPLGMPLCGYDVSQNKRCVALPQLAIHLKAILQHFYQTPTQQFDITGVTGTNGKTTIAFQLAQAHQYLGHKAAYIGTLGYGEVAHLNPLVNTTPDLICLQRILHELYQQQIKHICMEVSSHGLAENRIDGIEFTHGIFTNLTHDHLDYHHTMESYAAAKARLFQMPSLKYAILNADDSYSPFMAEKLPKDCQKLTYGLHAGADVRIIQWHMSMSGSECEVVSPWGKHLLKLNLLGAFNIYNSLSIFTSLLAYGYDADRVVEAMAHLKASPGRMEMVATNPCVVIDYAHTPDALKNVLMTLNELKKGHLWVVFGCGGDRDSTKRPVMGSIASQYADRIMLTSDNPRHEDPTEIMAQIAHGIGGDKAYLSIVDRTAAIHQVLSLASSDDIILIAGKGHEPYQQVGDTRLPFSDQKVVKEYF